jgi:SAM-dependent methyltransferase
MDMKQTGQALTYRTYEDPVVVKAFLAKNGEPRNGHEHIWPPLREFATLVGAGRILDIGCGPGIHARQFARLGFQVTAIDYSLSMLNVAKNYGDNEAITYVDLDMREIGGAFAPASFDAAWASASLVHVPEIDVPKVLAGIRSVLIPGGLFHVSLKGGAQGAKVVHDNKYGLPMEREFIFWREDAFSGLLRGAGFDIVHVTLQLGGETGGEPTRWIVFTARAI